MREGREDRRRHDDRRPGDGFLVSSCATGWHTTPTAPARVFAEEMSWGGAAGRAMIRTALTHIEGYPMLTYMLVAILSVIWLIMIGLGHRRYWALTWPGLIVVICVVRAWLEVRRGLPWRRG